METYWTQFDTADAPVIETDILVIGSGAAGLQTAWSLAEAGREVLVAVRDELQDSNTAKAQGGIAAALGKDDDPALHYQDTLVAGAGLTDEKMAKIVVTEGPQAVLDLLHHGAQFDRNPDGTLALGREGCHSRNRIVHANGDSTGAEVSRALRAIAGREKRIRTLEHCYVTDLLVRDGICWGAMALHQGKMLHIRARGTVLATGGVGRLFAHTTNPEGAVGSGLALAYRAGAELMELSFYYMNLVTVSRLQRNPTVKSEIQMRNFETSIPVGFFCYPISQAADITAFKATTVPAGEDQKPMIEQCCEIVHKFNSVYGDTLVEPEIVLPQNAACLRLPGIDGKAKMSKSLGNCIYLSEEPEDIKKKVMSMYTDPNHLRVQDPGQVEGNPVFIYLDAFCRPEHFAEFWPEYQNLDEVKAHYQRGGLGDVKVKKFLNSVMQAELEPIRTRRKEWEQRLPEVVEILKEGSAYAEKTAAATLADVRRSMRIDYFDNDNLLK